MTENIFFENLKNKNISDSSLKLYINNLKRLNDGNPIKNYKFLTDTEKIVEKIKDYKPNTRRTYIIYIVSLLKQEPKQKKLYDKYYTLLLEYNKDLKTNNVKSETQSENWLTQDQVKETYKKLEDDIKPKLEKKKLTPAEFNELLSYVVLSLYTLQPPRRNLDYQYCVVVKKYSPDFDKKYNYLDLENNEFHFNNFKTKKTYSTQTVPVSVELQKVIKDYLKFHPLKKKVPFPLLVSADGEPFESTNTITRILNKIFGRKVGSSLLRNIYLTSKYSNNLQSLNKDAAEMGTSAATIQNQYIKTDNLPKEIIL
jgi:integrase